MEQSPIENEADDQEADENADPRRTINSDATSSDVIQSKSSSSDDVTSGGRSVVMRRRLRDDDLDPAVEYLSPEFAAKEPYEIHVEIESCDEHEIPELPHPRLPEDSRSSAFAEILKVISDLEDVKERPISRLFDEGQGCHSAVESLKYFLGRLKI